MPRVEVTVISPIVQVTSPITGVQLAEVLVHDKHVDVTVQDKEITVAEGKLDVSQFVTRGETGLFYPASNPSGFVDSTSGITKPEADSWYYPLSNPSGFEPAHFGIDLRIVRSGDFIKEIQYADASKTELFYSGTQVTGIGYGTYTKLILYSGEVVTGIKYV